jgi:hypothetical protein
MVLTLSRRARAFGLLVLATCLVALATAAAPAGAALGISCPYPTSQVFLPWGDLAFYSYAPDGGFERGASGWTLAGGAQVFAGNESFYVNSRSDVSSLALPAGSSATSPPMCVALLASKMRFFVTNAGASSSRLKVQVIYGGGLGGLLSSVGRTLGVADVGYVTADGTWQPSDAISMLGGVLPLFTKYVQFRFVPADGTGQFRIDDVYLDPLMHL